MSRCWPACAQPAGKHHRDWVNRGLLFNVGSDPDFDDSSRVIAFLVAGGLGMPDRDYYLKDDAKSKDLLRGYASHLARVFELIGESAEQSQLSAATVVSMETALAKASLSRVDKRDPYKLKHKLTRSQLKAIAPRFDWNAYFKTIGAPEFQVVNVTEPEFFKELNRQLESSSIADWKTYLRWHVAHAAARHLTGKFATEDFDFYSKQLRGVQSMPPRWKRCARLTDQLLGEDLGQLFVAKTFTPDTRKRALEMNSEIQQAMEEEIQNLPWMSNETKKQALEKLHGMVNKIGYPDKWRDYSAVKVSRGDFIASLASAVANENRYQLSKIGRSVNRAEWRMTPPTVNAYYDPQTNDINFPAGVLQPPLFDAKMDHAPNYGNTGATIGHELTHGFDDEGRQFDVKGNLRDWWTKQDADEFSKRAACVADQYAQYTVVDDIKINSKLTLGEDLADLGGTIIAYLAWKRVTAKQQLAPVDGFTPDQRFFIGFAQWACGDERPEQKRLRAATNPHSPGEYRINGVVVNMREFGAAFACKAGEPMVKEQVCRVW